MGILQRHTFFCKSYGFARMQTKSGCDEQLMKHSIRTKNLKHSIRKKTTEGWMQTKSIRMSY